MKNNISIKIAKSPEATESVGEKFSEQISAGEIICLYGELGAGKTTFVRGFVKGLGFGDRVMSPTFTIVRTYHKNDNINLCCYHIDLYRLDENANVESIGIEDIFADKNGVVLIEWPERMRELLPKKRWDIFFDVIQDSDREIKIIKNE